MSERGVMVLNRYWEKYPDVLSDPFNEAGIVCWGAGNADAARSAIHERVPDIGWVVVDAYFPLHAGESPSVSGALKTFDILDQGSELVPPNQAEAAREITVTPVSDMYWKSTDFVTQARKLGGNLLLPSDWDRNVLIYGRDQTISWLINHINRTRH